MDDHIRKLDTKIRSKETELNALYTKIQKLEEEIATLHHKKLISKKRETVEISLTSVLETIFETGGRGGERVNYQRTQNGNSGSKVLIP